MASAYIGGGSEYWKSDLLAIRKSSYNPVLLPIAHAAERIDESRTREDTVRACGCSG
jgi:hypothetical protein